MSVDDLRTIGGAIGVRLELLPRWRGGAFDRLLDQGHARIGEHATRVLVRASWQVVLEYSFNHFGERGSVDIVAWHEPTRTLVLIEIKTRVFDLQDLLSSSHRKARVVPGLLRRERALGAVNLGRIVVLVHTPESVPGAALRREHRFRVPRAHERDQTVA
jgi:hypothetical protein